MTQPDSNWVEMEIPDERTYPDLYGDMTDIITVGPGVVRVPLRIALDWGWLPEPPVEPEPVEEDMPPAEDEPETR